MELPGMLQTIAEVSIAFAGFSGLIVAFRKNAGPLTDVQKYRLQVLLSLAFGAMFLSLLPELLTYFELPAATVWTASSLVLAVYSGIFLFWWLAASQKVKRTSPELFNWIAFSRMAIGHVAVLIAVLTMAIRPQASLVAGVYISALIWYLLHAAQQFRRMLFVQPRNQ